MADILDIIVQFFKISQDLVTKHANEGPVAQMFYLLFFPTIFVLIFIYLITARGLLGVHKAFRILVSVAIYAFIILSGYYTYFVMFSEYWLYGLVILGALWMFWSRGGTHLDVDGGAGGRPQSKGIGSAVMSQLGQRAKKEITGERKRIEGRVDRALQSLREIQKVVKHDSEAWRAHTAEIQNARNALMEYEQALSVSGFVVGGDLKRKARDLNEILNNISKYEYKDKKAA